MKRKKGLAAILLVALLNGGCAPLRDWLAQSAGEVSSKESVEQTPSPASMPEAPVKEKSAEVLETLAVFQALENGAQAEEYARIVDRYVEQSGDVERFRLALALLMPGKGFSNAHKGRELLQEYLARAEPGDAGLEALARLLVSLVDERERLERRLAREKENSDTLARQLKELRDIENIMRQREVNGRPAL